MSHVSFLLLVRTSVCGCREDPNLVRPHLNLAHYIFKYPISKEGHKLRFQVDRNWRDMIPPTMATSGTIGHSLFLLFASRTPHSLGFPPTPVTSPFQSPFSCPLSLIAPSSALRGLLFSSHTPSLGDLVQVHVFKSHLDIDSSTFPTSSIHLPPKL